MYLITMYVLLGFTNLIYVANLLCVVHHPSPSQKMPYQSVHHLIASKPVSYLIAGPQYVV